MRPLYAVKLGYGNQTPLGLIQLVVVGVLQVGYCLQLAVGTEGPAVIGADEGGGVAVFGAAEPVAPVSADVEEGVDLALPVAHHQHRVFAHVGGEEVAGVENLGFVAEEEPAAGEDIFQLFLVDVVFAEDAGADQAPVGVNQLVHVGNDHEDFLSVCAEYAFLVWRLTGLHREARDPASLRPRPFFFWDILPYHAGQGADSGCLFQDTGAGFGSLNVVLLHGHTDTSNSTCTGWLASSKPTNMTSDKTSSSASSSVIRPSAAASFAIWVAILSPKAKSACRRRAL